MLNRQKWIRAKPNAAFIKFVSIYFCINLNIIIFLKTKLDLLTMIVKSLQELYPFIAKGKPVLGIDYGLKKTGIAISTPDHAISLSLTILTHDKDNEKITEIIKLAISKQVCAIIIGLPLDKQGLETLQSLNVKKFADKLASRVVLPVFLQDERFSSKAADNMLKILGLNRKERNNSDDLLAAGIILETSLLSIKKLYKS